MYVLIFICEPPSATESTSDFVAVVVFSFKGFGMSVHKNCIIVITVLFYWFIVFRLTYVGRISNIFLSIDRFLMARMYNLVSLLIVFSACGGMHTGSKLPVLTAYFPVLA